MLIKIKMIPTRMGSQRSAFGEIAKDEGGL